MVAQIAGYREGDRELADAVVGALLALNAAVAAAEKAGLAVQFTPTILQGLDGERDTRLNASISRPT